MLWPVGEGRRCFWSSWGWGRGTSSRTIRRLFVRTDRRLCIDLSYWRRRWAWRSISCRWSWRVWSRVAHPYCRDIGRKCCRSISARAGIVPFNEGTLPRCRCRQCNLRTGWRSPWWCACICCRSCRSGWRCGSGWGRARRAARSRWLDSSGSHAHRKRQVGLQSYTIDNFKVSTTYRASRSFVLAILP